MEWQNDIHNSFVSEFILVIIIVLIPTFPTFLSYHDSGIGSTPHEQIVKGFKNFLEKFVTLQNVFT